MDCGVAASQRPAAGPLLPKQGHSIKHSRRAVEPTGQQHCVNSLVSRTSYGSRCSKLTAPALPVPSSTASSERVDLADLVESEVLAVLQGEPGTTTNALLASLARSSRIPKLTQAELAQVLDNLSSTGLVFKDNRGNVRLSKAARGSLPWHSPETFQAAGSLTANQSASNGSDQADVNGHATTAEQLQQDIIHILEGAPGMTSSSLHAQLTRVTRGPRLSDDEFDSLVEALSTAGLLMRDNRGNVRLAAGIVSRSPSPSPSTFHTEQRASPATSAYQLQQPTGRGRHHLQPPARTAEEVVQAS
ncbi:hypothetical protein HaLaN_00980 [Haematococcus lacustris]|uniref:Uncharacterized protein n=1 Tax=Haematococcus lacustris TaxID=44745 RepID=A0A699Y8G3_HAELA|nr:hypothetical protein HaLaN_00980 [Haematococcus lacustris]